MNKLPNVPKPCGGKTPCPFKKDCMNGWLGEKRATEIAYSESFTCHKNNELQCAGHMLLKKEENQFYALAMRFKKLGMKTNLVLSGEETIFQTVKQFIDHHKN